MKKIEFELPVMDEIYSKLVAIEQKLDTINKRPTAPIWLTTKEAAVALGISTRTLQTYRDQGMIPYTQFGREVRYISEDIQQFLMDHYVRSRNQEGGAS